MQITFLKLLLIFLCELLYILLYSFSILSNSLSTFISKLTIRIKNYISKPQVRSLPAAGEFPPGPRPQHIRSGLT